MDRLFVSTDRPSAPQPTAATWHKHDREVSGTDAESRQGNDIGDDGNAQAADVQGIDGVVPLVFSAGLLVDKLTSLIQPMT